MRHEGGHAACKDVLQPARRRCRALICDRIKAFDEGANIFKLADDGSKIKGFRWTSERQTAATPTQAAAPAHSSET